MRWQAWKMHSCRSRRLLTRASAKTGFTRAAPLPSTRSMTNAGWMVAVREDFGAQTYWRLYLRAQLQDGSLGEPLRDTPWDLSARYNLDPKVYEQGGKYSDVPPGYWVDVTALAIQYGWERVPALAQLAYVLSRRALYRICADRRPGLVFSHASALSARCARHTHKGIAAYDHSHAHTAPHLDAPAHTHTASNPTHHQQHAHRPPQQTPTGTLLPSATPPTSFHESIDSSTPAENIGTSVARSERLSAVDEAVSHLTKRQLFVCATLCLLR